MSTEKKIFQIYSWIQEKLAVEKTMRILFVTLINICGSDFLWVSKKKVLKNKCLYLLKYIVEMILISF